MSSLWRPLVPVVESQPLALCDRRSVQSSDWEEVEKVQTQWIEESMYLRRNENHMWYWLSNQTQDEVTAIVVWDSAKADSVTGKLSSKIVTSCLVWLSNTSYSECTALFIQAAFSQSFCKTSGKYRGAFLDVVKVLNARIDCSALVRRNCVQGTFWAHRRVYSFCRPRLRLVLFIE